MKVNEQSKQVYLQRMTQQKTASLDAYKSNAYSSKGHQPVGISISNEAKELMKYAKMAKTYDANQADKVNRIKAQLADGTYEISSGKIADAMIKQFNK